MIKRIILSVLLVLFLTPGVCFAAKKWRLYEGCTLQDNPANDGDSFHVRYRTNSGRNRYYLFRLYFVDTPESDNSLPERIKEQAEYFGITEKETVQLGKKATKFTEKYLKDGFTAYSRLADARGRSKMSRDYAMIEVGDTFLAEALVENGLARVFGKTTELPNGKSAQNFVWRLKKLEREAQRKKLGGWAKKLSRREEMLQQAQERMQPKTTDSTDPAEPSVPSVDIRRPQTHAPAATTSLEPTRPDWTGETITLRKALPVFSLLEEGKQVGLLRSGAEVYVVDELPGDMLRLRFQAGDGRKFEAQCRVDDVMAE